MHFISGADKPVGFISARKIAEGAVVGNAGKLTPLSTTSRAELAQLLYNLLGK